MVHLVLRVLLIIVVLDSWQANISSTLVQSKSGTIGALTSPTEVALSLKILRALPWVEMLLPALCEALVDWVWKLLSRIRIANSSAIIHMRVDVLCCVRTGRAILTVDHQVILFATCSLQLELGVRLW